MVYTDQDKISDRGQIRSEPFFKPDWSLEYFRGVMYLGHLLAVRRAVLLKVGEIRGMPGGGDSLLSATKRLMACKILK